MGDKADTEQPVKGEEHLKAPAVPRKLKPQPNAILLLLSSKLFWTVVGLLLFTAVPASLYVGRLDSKVDNIQDGIKGVRDKLDRLSDGIGEQRERLGTLDQRVKATETGIQNIQTTVEHDRRERQQANRPAR